MKKNIKHYLFYFLVAGLIILLDQVTKELVRNNIVLGDSICAINGLCEYVRIVHWYNTGVAFGLFQGNSTIFAILISLVIVLITVFYSQLPRNDWFLKLALAFEMGGAAGNLIDRVQIGHVTDFMAVGDFAVFNVADACINIGVAFMFISILLEERRNRLKKKEDILEDAPDSSRDSHLDPISEEAVE
ncbi:MAG: signal peptidase II [Anaerolineaceae bacterium]|nr:signal peptidase II [Anaerolineaceae bacterium]